MMLGENKWSDETWKLIPKGTVGIELGVWRGLTSEKFLRRARHVHLVDPWSIVSYEDSDEFGDFDGYLRRYEKLVGTTNPKDFQKYYDDVAASVHKKFAGEPVTIHRCTADEFFKTFEGQVDWVYVDASHSFDGCLSDLRNSLKIVKPGGCIFGDDYWKKKPGVVRAVDVFIDETGLTLNIFNTTQYEIKV